MPDQMYAELRRRAELDGSTIRDYVLDMIRRDQDVPPRQEWLANVRGMEPVSGGRSAAEDLQTVREQRR